MRRPITKAPQRFHVNHSEAFLVLEGVFDSGRSEWRSEGRPWNTPKVADEVFGSPRSNDFERTENRLCAIQIVLVAVLGSA